MVAKIAHASLSKPTKSAAMEDFGCPDSAASPLLATGAPVDVAAAATPKNTSIVLESTCYGRIHGSVSNQDRIGLESNRNRIGIEIESESDSNRIDAELASDREREGRGKGQSGGGDDAPILNSLPVGLLMPVGHNPNRLMSSPCACENFPVNASLPESRVHVQAR